MATSSYRLHLLLAERLINGLKMIILILAHVHPPDGTFFACYRTVKYLNRHVNGLHPSAGEHRGMQRRNMWWVLLMCSVLVCVALSGCDGDDEDEVECFLVTELEPNDVFETPVYTSQAQDLGEMLFGDCFTITGDLITVDDANDGYGFLLLEEQNLAITLSHSDLNDFDVIIFDFDTGTRLATCASGLEPEVCDVGLLIGNIDVVVVPAPGSGLGNYTLDLVSF
jgi:hypothetical protein